MESRKALLGPHRRAAQRRHPSKGRRRSPPSRVSGEPPSASREHWMERAGPKGAENPVQRSFLRNTRKVLRVPLEHAEEQSSRARTSDGRRKASRCGRTFVPFAGRETSVVSSAGCRQGVLSKLPPAQSVTKRCSRSRRVGALFLLLGASDDPRLGALGPCRR